MGLLTAKPWGMLRRPSQTQGLFVQETGKTIWYHSLGTCHRESTETSILIIKL